MAIKQENKYTNITGTFPNALIVDASGPGLTDGSEFAALPLNDGWEPFQQAIMNYAAAVTLQNNPAGSVGVPNGIADAVGISQMLEALQLAHGIGPGKGVIWFLDDDPSVTGDRVLLLSGQGVLIASYPALDAAVYVGDGNNATVAAGGGKFYRSSDSGGATPNIAGPYLQLPEAPGRILRVLDTTGTVDPGGASRYLGDNQADAFQGHIFYNGMADDVAWAYVYGGTATEAPGLAINSIATGTPPVPNQQGLTSAPKNDGVNGVPRIDTETRMKNISIKLGITY